MMSTKVSFQFSLLSFSWLLVFVFLSVGFSNTVLALDDPDSESVHTLDPIVVTATKTPVPLSHVTSAVEVITEEDFQRRGVKTVSDALRLSQNLAVFSSGGPGSNTAVRMRGGTADQTLVILDGAVMNSGTIGQFNFAGLMTENIEKIEILRGAQSMVWGSDAIGGVINITTKRGKGISRVSSFFEYGSFNSIREGASLAGEHGPVDFSFSLSRWDFQGFSGINYRRGAVERDAHRNWTASSQFGVATPNEGRLSVNFRWIDSDVDFDSPSTFGGGPFDVFKLKSTDRQFIYGAAYEQPMTEWWDQQLTVARSEGELETQSGTIQQSVLTGAQSPAPTFNNSQIDTENTRLEWQHNFQIADPLLLTLGYQYRKQLGENSVQFSEKKLSSHAGFAELQLNLWDRVFATGGFRQDSHNTFGDATTYRVTGGYILKETGTKLRASYGTGFRAPDINELFFPNFGNPDLQAEKSQSLDVAVEQKFWGNRGKVSLGYFWNRYRQLIVSTFDPVGCAPLSPFGFCAQNVGSAKTHGWELSGNLIVAENLPFMKRLDVGGQYTYTLTRDLETAARLARWPVHQASVVLTYQPIDPLSLTATFRYVGSRFNTTGNQQPFPDFHVIHFAASYDITKNLQGYMRVENILNRNYEEVRFYGTAVRSIYGGVRVNFDLPVGDTNS